MMEPLAPPTWTTWVATIPSAAANPPAAADPVAEATPACVSEAASPAAPVAFMPDTSPACVVAAPSPTRADTITDLEKYIFAVVGDGIVKE